LEKELKTFKEIFPRADSKRAILSAAGSVFKFLFGTATIADYESLKDQVHELHSREENTVHFVNAQLTYLRDLDHLSKFNTKAVEVLSQQVKTIMLDSNLWKDRVEVTIPWLNATLFKQTNMFVHIRQLEFAILQLLIQIRQLQNGIENYLNGRLSLSLISPETLLDILKNVTFYLPDGYNLFTNLNKNDIHLYYEQMKTAFMASHQKLKLIFSIPLKTLDQHYNLYKLITPLFVQKIPYQLAPQY
jgi:hypothetical protein